MKVDEMILASFHSNQTSYFYKVVPDMQKEIHAMLNSIPPTDDEIGQDDYSFYDLKTA